MHIQALESLRSQDDRAALAAAVGRELAPPLGLARMHGRLVFESRQAQVLNKEQQSTQQERVIARATADQVGWLGGELRQVFLDAAQRMLKWCHRLQLSHDSEDWSAKAWVAAARDLEAESELLGLVITSADTLSWSAWTKAFSKEQDWPAQWFGWETAFAKSPRLASRWLETILDSNGLKKSPEELSRLSFSRGRIWQKIHINQAAGRPVESLTRLDALLADAGAVRQISSVDFTSFLKEEGRLVSPAAAKAALVEFLSSSQVDAKKWLASLPSPPHIPVVLSADRPDLRGLASLSWLASQGECDANLVREVFDQWATLLDDADWALIFDKAFLAGFGIEEPEQIDQAPPGKKTMPEKKKVPAKKESAKISSGQPAPTGISDPQVPLEAIPRFAKKR